jgi:hypothetical protein
MTHRAAAALRRLRANQSATRSDARRDKVDDLAERVEHLEAALEGLQDAVYRQDVVHDRQLAKPRKRQVTGPNARSPGPRAERP